MFKVKRGKAVLSPPKEERALLNFWKSILSDQIPAQPFSALLVEYFRQFFLPQPKDASKISVAFSFWDNDPVNQNARLVAADGFNFKSPNYLKLLRYNEGIVGTLLARYSKETSSEAYVSCSFEEDEYLASARAVREEFGFRSGIALPVTMHENLAGIFKIYCNLPLDDSVAADQSRLWLEGERLSLLLTLADSHFSSSLRKRFAERPY